MSLPSQQPQHAPERPLGRRFWRLRSGLAVTLTAVLITGLIALVSPAPARASYTMLCSGFADCRAKGYATFGYADAMKKMWWRMYAGRNCVNYAAWRMVRAGMPNERPWTGSGNGENWGKANAAITDNTPRVGAVAWWDSNQGGASSYGHVGVVDKVVSDSEIWVTESNWGSDFSWRVIYKGDNRWPTGFIHFIDKQVAVKKQPAFKATPKVGSPLTVSVGKYSNAAATAVAWYLDGKLIKKATGTSYTPLAGQVGKRITAKITAKADGFQPVTAETTSAAVAKGDLSATAAPTIAGTAQIDQTLTLTDATFDPQAPKQTVQWYADDRPIAGATGWSLTLGRGQADAIITASVTGIRNGFNTSTATSAGVGPVLDPQIEMARPGRIQGSSRVGQTLTADPGTFAPADARASYQWLRDGRPIAGADQASYTLRGADAGHAISVNVTARRKNYLDFAASYQAGSTVATESTVTTRARVRKGTATVQVHVTAPGVKPVGGLVFVKIGAHTVSGKLVNGRMKISTPVGRRHDRLKVVVSYVGTSVVLPGRSVSTVVVN